MPKKKDPNRYDRLIESVFLAGYKSGIQTIPFTKLQFEDVAKNLDISLPKNVPDVIYSFRYRNDFPAQIVGTASPGKEWIIRGTGKGRYSFCHVKHISFKPSDNFAETKIPNATPGIIARYALDDEQALLAKVRFNRLVDIFTGLTCYSLQNHLRTSVKNMGQVETDEIYVGLDKRGVHYIIPVQAKGGKDRLGRVQIEQDFALCAEKFPGLICKSIAAQFLPNDVIVLFEMEFDGDEMAIIGEKHYRLVEPGVLSDAELETYKTRLS